MATYFQVMYSIVNITRKSIHNLNVKEFSGIKTLHDFNHLVSIYIEDALMAISHAVNNSHIRSRLKLLTFHAFKALWMLELNNVYNVACFLLCLLLLK